MTGDNSTITTKRLSARDAGGKQAYSTLLSGVACYIEPVDPRRTPSFTQGNQVFDLYLCIIQEIVDVRKGDRITDQDGQEFVAAGVRVLRNTDVPGHIEIYMTIRSDA